jgi:hypothetical protein
MHAKQLNEVIANFVTSLCNNTGNGERRFQVGKETAFKESGESIARRSSIPPTTAYA